MSPRPKCGTRRYRAFGLTLESALELTSLDEVDDDAALADVVVAIGDAKPMLGTCIAWDGVCQLAATNGKRLEVHPLPAALDADLELAVLGAGLALIFEQRGFVVLHGSCVAVNDTALSLVGPSGAGKSTISAALVAAGATFVSDGMTVLDVSRPGEVLVRPGPALVKLLPDAAHTLGFRPEALPRVHVASPKVRVIPPTQGSDSPLRLGAVLVLSDHERPMLSPLGASASAFALVKNFFLIDELGPSRGPAILEACSEVARRVPCHALQRATLRQLPDVLELVRSLVRRN